MSEIQETINSIAEGLHAANLLDAKTLKNFKESDLPELNEYTGEEIQHIREKEKLSQSVFAKYLNISPGMVRSLEQGQRRAQGAILRLLNLIDKKGISSLA